MKKEFALLLCAALLTAALAGCGTVSASSPQSTPAAASGTTAATAVAQTGTETAVEAVYTMDDQFSQRDMTQTADLSEAETIVLESGRDVTITEAGVYVLRGTAENTTVIVEAGDEDKVQLVLDGVSITNADFPCIYVKNADKTFLTTTDSENTLTVTGSFRADGDTNTDAVVFSRDDLTLNGTGTLTLSSRENGVSCKDDLKITGGTLSITCAADALEAKDSIRVAGGSITILTEKDGLHAEDSDDDTTGYVYIAGGSLSIRAGDDAIHATTVLQIDGGELTLEAAEALEGTRVQVNGGTLNISASDDGINGSHKSKSMAVAVEITGGTITINMGAGDTDAIDSNGDLTITGGTLDITAQSPFDYDGTLTHTGGTITLNGQETDTITNQFGGMMGGPGGGFGGKGGFPGGQEGEPPQGGFPGGQEGESPQGGFPGGQEGEPPQGGFPGGQEGEPPQGGFPGGQGGQPPEGGRPGGMPPQGNQKTV